MKSAEFEYSARKQKTECDGAFSQVTGARAKRQREESQADRLFACLVTSILR